MARLPFPVNGGGGREVQCWRWDCVETEEKNAMDDGDVRRRFVRVPVRMEMLLRNFCSV